MATTVGRRLAVVELPNGLRLHGTLAWLSWLALHTSSTWPVVDTVSQSWRTGSGITLPGVRVPGVPCSTDFSHRAFLRSAATSVRRL